MHGVRSSTRAIMSVSVCKCVFATSSLNPRLAMLLQLTFSLSASGRTVQQENRESAPAMGMPVGWESKQKRFQHPSKQHQHQWSVLRQAESPTPQTKRICEFFVVRALDIIRDSTSFSRVSFTGVRATRSSTTRRYNALRMHGNWMLYRLVYPATSVSLLNSLLESNASRREAGNDDCAHPVLDQLMRGFHLRMGIYIYYIRKTSCKDRKKNLLSAACIQVESAQRWARFISQPRIQTHVALSVLLRKGKGAQQTHWRSFSANRAAYNPSSNSVPPCIRSRVSSPLL